MPPSSDDISKLWPAPGGAGSDSLAPPAFPAPRHQTLVAAPAARQMAGNPSAAAVAGGPDIDRMTLLEDRLSMLEDRVGEIGGLLQVPTGEGDAALESRLRSMRAGLEETVVSRLARVRSEAVEATTAMLAAAEDDMNRRFDAIDVITEQLRAQAAATAALGPSATTALAPLHSDIHVLKEEVRALTAAVAALRKAAKDAASRAVSREAKPPAASEPARRPRKS